MIRRVLPCISTFVFASAFAVSVFAEEADTAYVPFIVNVDAEIFAVGEGVIVPPIHVTANKPDTLIITVAKGGFASILNRARTRMNTPALMSGSHGKISLNLSGQSYKKADISLYSINGKRILRGKADASRAVKNISRPNLVAGVYLLSVKGTNGQSFSNRLTHRGGSLDISVVFGGSETNYLTEKPVAIAAAESGGWMITVSANGYRDSSYTLNVLKGDNELQTITLVASGNGGSHFNPDITYGSFTDTRGGKSQTYRTVVIGGKTWMAENLNYAGEEGNVIGVCYDNADSNCVKYGRLYTWTEAMNISSEYHNTLWDGSDVNHLGVCPADWHVPSDAEWTTLTDFVGGASTAGTKLKSQTGWNSYEGISSTDEYGFSALPGGVRGTDVGFGNAGSFGRWWSATELGAIGALGRGMDYGYEDVDSYWDVKTYSFSVRCLQDVRP